VRVAAVAPGEPVAVPDGVVAVGVPPVDVPVAVPVVEPDGDDDVVVDVVDVVWLEERAGARCGVRTVVGRDVTASVGL
jgi:hypothetical protein